MGQVMSLEQVSTPADLDRYEFGRMKGLLRASHRCLFLVNEALGVSPGPNTAQRDDFYRDLVDIITESGEILKRIQQRTVLPF